MPPPITIPRISATYGLEVRDCSVEPVLVAPEGAAARWIAATVLVEKPYVAAATEGAVAGAVDHDPGDAPVVAPFIERTMNLAHHVMGQRVERLRPIDGDATGRTLDTKQDIAHPESRASSERAMMTRMISLVPSRIW